MNIPIYDITFNSENPDDLFLCNSLVDYPAVEVDFLAFKQQSIEDKEKLFTFEKDTVEHKIFGVAIRADFPIYRLDSYGREYFVRFSKETIEQLVLKYSKDNNFNVVSLQHDGNLVEGVNLIELFIKDSSKGLNPVGFESIEDGSLFCTYKVENPDVWEKIQSGDIKGFSIEIVADIQPTNESIELSKQEPEEDDINSFINDLYNYLIGEGIDSNEIEILFADSKKKIIEDSIKQKKPINIKIEGSSKIHNGFVYSIFDVDGSNNIALYNYTKKEWELINLSNIEKVNINSKSNAFIDWQIAQQQKGFTWIQNIIENATNVKETALQPTNFYEDIIMNKKIVMLKYSDGDGRCETYRQCLVCEYGITCAGNTAIRAYEYSGTSHNVLDGTGEIPDWRTFLISRITDIKLAPEGLFKPITQAPPKFNPNPEKDRDNFIVIYKSVFD